MDKLNERERILMDAIDTDRLESDDPELIATVEAYREIEGLLERWSLPFELPDELDVANQLSDLEGYEIQKELGSGGFGRVYLANDLRLDRQVAIKIPTWDRMLTDDHAAKMLHEARTAAKLSHPGIVTIHDVKKISGLVVVVYEFVDSDSLEELLKNTNVDPNNIARMLGQVADALVHVHRQGIVHGDLKPSNILVDRMGTPKIADFGLGVHDSERLNFCAKGAGTLPYMSPEQLNREDYLDGRVDIWAVGIILYRSLTGKLPFSGTNSEETKHAICHRAPKPMRQINPSISPQLEKICLKCMEKDPKRRYASASELARDLKRIGTNTSRRNQMVVFATLVTLIILTGIFLNWPQAMTPAISIRSDDLVVQRYDFARGTSSHATSVGRIGVTTATARYDDDVAIELSFRTPAYFYLIAFNPNGTVELCWPKNENAVPEATDAAICPSKNDVYGLTDGTGAQVFLLFADSKPLPSYSDWKSSHAKIPWENTAGYSDTVWFFDKINGFRPGANNRFRVGTRSRSAPDSFVRVCEFFSEKSNSNNVAAVLFPVTE